MNRSILFSTGLECNFWFGVQTSNDILKFGGQQLFAQNSKTLYTRYHTWNCAEAVWKHILRMSAVNETMLKEWLSQFPKSIDGTKQLKADIEFSHFGNEASLVLGLLIWHQLTYTTRMYAEYQC
jgi:hypothetical protein